MMQQRYLEKCIVQYCSPTLANIKPGSLFTCSAEDTIRLGYEVADINRRLNKKDVYVRLMNISSGRAMVYVYRKEMLCRNLKNKEISDFLMNTGYDLNDVDSVVRCLRKRIISGNLPHEIGLFLGYPLHDVIGFIENKGKNYLCLGCWKVYCDECGAKKKFCQYKACKNEYLQMFKSGKSISDLACSA